MGFRKYYIDIVENKRNGFMISIIRVVLFFLSLIYRAVIKLRNKLYDRDFICKGHKVDIPVVSVGNITWGGTGKTSLVIFLARMFSYKRTAVLTRGYGQDEVELLRKSLKDFSVNVFVGKNRLKLLVDNSADYDLAFLDDAYQYRKIKPDVNILLINGADSFGNGSVLPRGKLREPMDSIKRADIIVVMYEDLDASSLSYIKKVNSDVSFFKAAYRVVGVSDLKGNSYSRDAVSGKKWASFSAIGYPTGFLNSLKSLGICPEENFAYPDHHNLTEKEFRKIEKKCFSGNIDSLIITAKDRSRFKFATALAIFVLDVELKVDKEEQFKKAIEKCIQC